MTPNEKKLFMMLLANEASKFCMPYAKHEARLAVERAHAFFICLKDLKHNILNSQLNVFDGDAYYDFLELFD